jgi:hypothetical protein
MGHENEFVQGPASSPLATQAIGRRLMSITFIVLEEFFSASWTAIIN